jgi:hypothetical protein
MGSKKGKSVKVNVYDFRDPVSKRPNPYGVLDLFNNIFVNIGTNRNTSFFAIASIKTCWHECGYELYNGYRELLITADSGESNSYRTKLCKLKLQLLAETIGSHISVCHFLPRNLQAEQNRT